MLKHILTGGIDLPKLDAKVSSLELALAEKYEETNKALADHIAKANEQLASRALAEDVETLRMKLDRVDDYTETTSEELHDAVQKLATIKANHEDIAALRATVAGLAAKVEALTAAKLSEVKARKAPKKSG
jgi:prophage DNA circulation protein